MQYKVDIFHSSHDSKFDANHRIHHQQIPLPPNHYGAFAHLSTEAFLLFFSQHIPIVFNYKLNSIWFCSVKVNLFNEKLSFVSIAVLFVWMFHCYFLFQIYQHPYEIKFFSLLTPVQLLLMAYVSSSELWISQSKPENLLFC